VRQAESPAVAGDPMNLIWVIPARGNMRNIAEAVSGQFAISIQEDGYINPRNTAARIVSAIATTDSEIQEQLVRGILETPTMGSLYEDAPPFITEIVEDPENRIDIWTNEYMQRVASSGLGDLRRQMTSDQRKRFGVLFDPQDKLSLLPDIFEQARCQSTQLAIIDDKETNLVKAREIAASHDVIEKVHFIHLSRGETARLNGFFHVSSLSDVLHALPNFSGRFLVDFNGVLIDSTNHQTELVQIAARAITVYSASNDSS